MSECMRANQRSGWLALHIPAFLATLLQDMEFTAGKLLRECLPCCAKPLKDAFLGLLGLSDSGPALFLLARWVGATAAGAVRVGGPELAILCLSASARGADSIMVQWAKKCDWHGPHSGHWLECGRLSLLETFSYMCM